MFTSVSIGSADVYYGDPTDEMFLLDGIQGEIRVAGGATLSGPKPNRAYGAYEQGNVYAWPVPPTVELPYTDDSPEVLARLWPTAVYDEVSGRFAFGDRLSKVAETTIIIVPEIAIATGREEELSIILPAAVPTVETIQEFNAPGADTSKTRGVTISTVRASADQAGNVIPDGLRLGWRGPLPAGLAAAWTALPYATAPA